MVSAKPLRLGTRRSKLARWQADWVADRLRREGFDIQLVFISTSGDAQQAPIGSLGGVGLFTKAIQEALLENRIDLAVHSLKDLPTGPTDGLTLAAVPKREVVGDALICRRANGLSDLPSKARVGTGSLRRRAQLLNLRSDLQIEGIRGNIDTRLRKLGEGQFEAIILAQAGLKRLNLETRITQRFSPLEIFPAVGQGALGIETRIDDRQTQTRVKTLNHNNSRIAVTTERCLLDELDGGCLAPIGAWARMSESNLVVDGIVLSADGCQRLTASAKGDPRRYEELAKSVARRLVADGARELIRRSRQSS